MHVTVQKLEQLEYSGQDMKSTSPAVKEGWLFRGKSDQRRRGSSEQYCDPRFSLHTPEGYGSPVK